MRERLLELLKERGEIHATEINTLIPEFNGDYTLYMPVIKGVNPRIIFFSNVSLEFKDIIYQLMIKEKIVTWQPVNWWTVIYEGLPIIAGVPIAEKKYVKSKKECWLPIVIKLKELA